jgi:hypothetical protein
MTEAEWLTAGSVPSWEEWIKLRPRSPRKERLFACACCRRLWDRLHDKRGRAAVVAAEQFADGLIDREALARARSAAARAVNDAMAADRQPGAVPEHVAMMTTHTPEAEVFLHGHAWAGNVAERLGIIPVASAAGYVHAALLRDIFGNPFRPVLADPSWHTSTVVALARGMYESRNFSAMPILADALQDAGCDNSDILNHCRGTGPHVRGCWVVDLVLGKE